MPAAELSARSMGYGSLTQHGTTMRVRVIVLEDLTWDRDPGPSLSGEVLDNNS